MNLSLSFLYPLFLWLLALFPLFVALGWPQRRAPDRRQRGWGLATRLLILVALVLALAGAQIEWPVDTITTVFVLDVSDSISSDDRAATESFLREALAHKPANDRAAVVIFGGDALVEQLPRTQADMPALASTPIKNATNLEAALRLALALLPNEGGRRIVLFSDGQETSGSARQLLNLAVARQVEINVYPLGRFDTASLSEVRVEQVTAPAQARQGQEVPVMVEIQASQTMPATLHLLADGDLVESRPVRLSQGGNKFEFTLPATGTGFRRFRVEVEAAQDGRLQNNWGAAFTTVYGPPQVLVVEGQAGEAANLSQALQAARLTATVVAPPGLPNSLPGLAAYDTVVLVNVPATALPAKTQELLTGYVRDLGRGLVMIGGPQSYGAGGYLRSPLEKALPVEMEVRSRSREPNLAVVLAVDKSGSMGACHCDDPNNRLQQQARVVSGLPKIDIAKQAILQTASVLGNFDYLGVVSFDSSAHWQLPPSPWTGEVSLEEAIGGMAANGQTNIYAGLAAAEESLDTVPARVKHIILLTDGWSNSGAYDELIARLAQKGITLSVVAAGNGSATYLAELARKGGGQYYPATNMNDVPQIFLKETIRAAGNYLIEESFRPVVTVSGGGIAASPVVAGVDWATAPALLGYNGTTLKGATRAALLTPRGDPLLTTWQYGLGRSVAWTSDVSGRWAKNWLEWEGFTRLVGQMVTWSLPRPDDEQLDLAVSVRGGEVTLTAQSSDTGAKGFTPWQVVARLLAADGKVIETELRASGPQQYQVSLPLPAEGVYLAQVTAFSQNSEGEPVASQTTGLIVPYSPEYAEQSANLPLLTDLAVATGGQPITDVSQAFAHTLAVGRQTRPIWPGLLLLAALLLPVDIALRRLRVGRREWQQTQAWLQRHWPYRRVSPALQPDLPPASPVVQAFRQAQQRTRRQPEETGQGTAQNAPPVVLEQPSPRVNIAPKSETPPAPPATPSGLKPTPSSAEEQDTLARLRAAKKRVKR